LTPEYKQVPLKHGEVGQAFPHFIEIQDLFTATKESEVWRKFAETGEQDLDGFGGDDDDEFHAEEEDNAAVYGESYGLDPNWTLAKIKTHPKFELFEKDRRYWYPLENVHVNLCTSYRTHVNSTMNQYMVEAMVWGGGNLCKRAQSRSPS